MKKSRIWKVVGVLLAGTMTLCGCAQEQKNAVVDEQKEDVREEISVEDENKDDTGEDISVQEVLGNQALAVKELPQKEIEKNPYMSDNESNIHNDSHNSDVTDAVLPIGIYPEVNTAYEKVNGSAPPAIFYDEYEHAVCPLMGGIAIRDMNTKDVTTLGCYVPAQHEESYAIQSSYSFVDHENHIVCPTSHNHIIIFQSLDEEGNVLPTFEKLMDIDIKAEAEKALGKELDQNLLSITYDFDGNLWFVTGGFRIYPDRKQQGVVGYISKNAIEDLLSGKNVDLENEMHFYEMEPGEGAENGIASSKAGTVILTNLSCYLFRAEEEVQVAWRTEYGSTGAKDSRADAKTTGGGLAWGGGASPSLTDNLVCFTDNEEPINLIALDMETGEVVASMPVLDELPEDMPVSVENSIIVYDGGEDVTSVIICNWFGAGSAGLASEGSDSSIQTFSNIYDSNWIAMGNEMIMPGMERADIVKTADGYEMKSVWFRDDIRDTSMFKLSTATGYLYGYVQDLESGMWQYIILDFETGETVLTVDVSREAGYNNMAIGMFNGQNGNALYCPTGYLELLRLQDRFVYLPDSPYHKVDLDKTSRERIDKETFQAEGGNGETPASYLHTAAVENVHPSTTIAFCMTGLTGNPQDLVLYARNAEGVFTQVEETLWSLEGAEDTLEANQIYEVFFTCEDGGVYDLNPEEKEIKASVLLVHGVE